MPTLPLYEWIQALGGFYDRYAAVSRVAFLAFIEAACATKGKGSASYSQKRGLTRTRGGMIHTIM